MLLTVKDIINKIEDFAPLGFQQSYDNSGFSVGSTEAEVTSIIFAMDCTMDVIDEAITSGANLIVTHHPLLFRKPNSITDETLIGRKILKLIQNGINLYSCHTNLDVTSGGLNDLLMELLNFDSYESIFSSKTDEFSKNNGIGRVGLIKNGILLSELCEGIKEKLNLTHIRVCGDLNILIKKVAVINGSGNDLISEAFLSGVDCVITGDTTYHYASDYKELGLAIVDAGHFETEWLPFIYFGKNLQRELATIGYENKIYFSKQSESPYKYI